MRCRTVNDACVNCGGTLDSKRCPAEVDIDELLAMNAGQIPPRSVKITFVQSLSIAANQLVSLSGPGSELVGLLHQLGARHTDQCQCAAKAAQMNLWGAACREHRDEIIAWLYESAWSQWITTQAGVGWEACKQPWFRVFDPIGSIVDEAIRRAGARPQAQVTLSQVRQVLEQGVKSVEEIMVALNLDTPPVIVEQWLDSRCEQREIASLTIDGQKHYGLPDRAL